eukprot:9350882-Alexandrium_andersonii.AAC.1
MKALDRQRRATHIDELERYQMEEAVRGSMADQPPGMAQASAGAALEVRLPPGRAVEPATATSTHAEALLKE